MISSIFLGILSLERKVSAQIVPDNTLDRENSIASPQESQGKINIRGGAVRDGALFHSFQEFNVQESQQVYFANPDGVFNILTRVTGRNISNILGTLGVNGNANLFLINPNGIHFGENAKLDLHGSFTATTADSILIDSFEFSATAPETPPLLKINIEPGIQYGRNPRDREIQNTGNLEVDLGQNITLFAGSILNTGNLIALGGKIEVLGTIINLSGDSQIDVSARTGGGSILIGGSDRGQGSKPTADRVYIGEDVLIRADASGAIGNGGKVIIWSNEITGFSGEINARGGNNSGNGGFVEVSGKEYLIFSGFVDVSAIDGQKGTILLDPRNITISNAPDSPSVIPALSDQQILAGEIPNGNININKNTLEILSGNIVLEATENIIIENGVNLNFLFSDSVTFRADADRNESGDFIMGINNNIFTHGDNLEIRGHNLALGNLDTNELTGDSGSIFLNAKGNILAQSLRSNSIFQAGQINVKSDGGAIAIFNAIQASSMNEEGNNVRLEAAGDLRIGTAIDTRGDEGGGNINLVSRNGTVSLVNANLASGTRAGNAGNIAISGNSIEFVNSTIASQILQQGSAGNIVINAPQVTLNHSTIASSGGVQKSGNIQIFATSLALENASKVEIFSPSNGGNLSITTTALSLSDRSRLRTQTNGTEGGNISINTGNLTLRNNSSIFTDVRSAIGTSGKIEIDASEFIAAVLSENSDIFTRGEEGRQGELTVTARGIFGFNFGDNLTGESDILEAVESAFSEFEEFDREFDEYEHKRPLIFRRPREEFSQQCGINGYNEFAIAGRSGIRTNPNQILRGREIWEDRRDFSTSQNSTEIEGIETNTNREIVEPFREARGWKINRRGNIELIGEQLSMNNVQCTKNHKKAM
ncbi:filamentous hemagglutinin N-terminal domain-containing protein [Spirulina sp. 06S082]|uniref:two-partner secretion domain-containing protein n=1 Tax=Spirulina sp. 06S082 TaxID=3110248 RepID=UPI002B1FA26C|nr:filamentous hemagglutinin N-terminal domain-containing protein [Spirulina sp. 06S082]MEA5467841.1 filamentous hemagglutinin N-terminal domain-containing protein [Spirulina sp. 06S082]